MQWIGNWIEIKKFKEKYYFISCLNSTRKTVEIKLLVNYESVITETLVIKKNEPNIIKQKLGYLYIGDKVYYTITHYFMWWHVKTQEA